MPDGGEWVLDVVEDDEDDKDALGGRESGDSVLTWPTSGTSCISSAQGCPELPSSEVCLL